jgi:hypothetical protein
MFKIDYSIWLNGKQYSSAYPREGTANSNVFSLKGKNDNGKTTLLKIVAEAFGASERDNNTISNHLKRDISDIADKENKLNYDLTLSYPDGSTTVNVSFDSKEHRYKINGSPVGKTEFLRQYAVLFEVREKMSDKLDRHMKDVENRFDKYLNYIKIYEGRLRELFEKVSNYERSEESLKRAKTSIKNIEDKLSNYGELKKLYHESYVKARKEYINYIFEKKTLEFQGLEGQINGLKKRIQQAKKAEIPDSTGTKALLDKSNSLRDNVWDSKLLFQHLSNQELKKDFNDLSNNLKCLSNPQSLTFEYLSSISTFFQRVQDYIKEEGKGDTSSDRYKEGQELSFLKSLLEIVKKYSNTDLELPGSGKKLIELLSPLESRYKELRLLLGQFEILDALDKKCRALISEIGEVAVELKKYMDRDKQNDETSDGENIDELNKLFKINDKKRDEVSKELTMIDDEYNNILPDEKQGFRLDPGVVEDYNKSKKNYEDTVGEIKEAELQLEIQKQYEQKFKDIKRPNTRLTSQDIISLSEDVEKLKSKFSKYTSKLRDINLSKLEQGEQLDKDDSDFFSKIGSYLANVVEVMYHEHKMLKIKQIDFQKRLYVLEDGTTIKMSTVGSGHSSLNAITSRMKNNFPDKKKILLIDEITDMDPGVKSFLINEVKNQILSGESVLALLTEWDYSSVENELVPIT